MSQWVLVEKISRWIVLGPGFFWTKLASLGKETEIAKRVEVVNEGVCAGQEETEGRKAGRLNQGPEGSVDLKDRCDEGKASTGLIGSGS